jgi:hypothetical protein
MRLIRTTIVLTICLWTLCLSSVAAKGPVLLNVDIPAGKWKGVRLRNLPKDAVVAVQVESSDEILVALMDSKSFQHFSKTSRPLFLGQVEKKLAFTVSIPRAGDHFLVFDNRTGAQSRAVTVTIRAARGSADQMEAANKIFKEPSGSFTKSLFLTQFRSLSNSVARQRPSSMPRVWCYAESTSIIFTTRLKIEKKRRRPSLFLFFMR